MSKCFFFYFKSNTFYQTVNNYIELCKIVHTHKDKRDIYHHLHLLKGRYTFGSSQRPVFSLGVSQHKHKTTFEHFSLTGQRNCEKMIEKTTLLDELVCFQTGKKDFQLEVFYYFGDRLPLFSKSMLFQREPFLTMLYTINSSAMLNTKSVFKLF